MIEECLFVMELIMDDFDVLKILMIFLLDVKGNMDDCSKLLFVYKNMVKYCIKKICEFIGYDVIINFELYDVYIVCMVYCFIYD